MPNDYEDMFLKAQEYANIFSKKLYNIIKDKYKKPFLLEFRIKSFESINRKQELWQREYNFRPSFEKLPDIIGYRLSVENEEDCTVMSDVISEYLNPNRLIDYFNHPKETGFKAYLYYIEEDKFNSEIQIMTLSMRGWTNSTHQEHVIRKYGSNH